MKSRSTSRIERYAVPVISATGAILIFLIWFSILAFFHNQRRQLEQNIADQTRNLASRDYLLGTDVLTTELQAEQKNHEQLLTEWSNTVVRLSCLHGIEELSSAKIGKIDFKFALFEVKERLTRKARTLDINLPRDLGMDSAVRSDEDARKLMLQLRALEKLMDLILDLKITSVKFVEPLPVEFFNVPELPQAYLEEYPIKIQFYCPVENMMELFTKILEPDRFFALRNFRIQSGSRHRPDMVNVQAVISALLFTRPPEALMGNQIIRTGTIAPKGH
jgi:hypothetical protein